MSSPVVPILFVSLLAAALGSGSLLRPDDERLRRMAATALRAALLLTGISWGLRWHEAGHLPLFGTWEGSLSLAFGVLLAVVASEEVARIRGRLAAAGGLVAAGMIAHGARFSRETWALTISERSIVVDLHAVLSWLALGVLAAHAGFAVAHLIAGAAARVDPSGRRLSISLQAGFLLQTAMIVSGSFYKFLLFGRAWSFDPVETLALLSWLAAGTVLHLHLFAGWSGRRLARWCLFNFALLVLSYRLVVHFPPSSTYHLFDIDRRLHLSGRSTDEAKP